MTKKRGINIDIDLGAYNKRAEYERTHTAEEKLQDLFNGLGNQIKQSGDIVEQNILNAGIDMINEMCQRDNPKFKIKKVT